MEAGFYRMIAWNAQIASRSCAKGEVTESQQGDNHRRWNHSHCFSVKGLQMPQLTCLQVDEMPAIRPRRVISGMSAILLPLLSGTEIDWDGFRGHVLRTADAATPI